MSTREQFLARFKSTSDAIEFETATLSIGRELLPPCARAVLDRQEPTPDYWDFLVSQIEGWAR